MTGLDGTPMPSWSDNIKPDEAWDLVFYLRSLQPMKSKEKANCPANWIEAGCSKCHSSASCTAMRVAPESKTGKGETNESRSAKLQA